MESAELIKAAGSQPPPHAFDVFLSYSRKDRAFAIYLESALESYRFPKSLNSDKRNLNVFRDEADIEAAGDYYRAIEQHLKGAAKLVVLCSPDARKSKYVEDEIKRFIETHNEKDIIPVLVKGKPNDETGDESEKAFPEVLCENRMPLAANFLGYDIRKSKLDKGQFRSPWYSILSAIYDIDRRRLEQIDEKLRARKRVIAIGVVTAIILILSAALVVALISRREAINERNRSISNELALYSTSLLQSDPELSLLLATKAAQTQQTQQSENALRQALVNAPLHVLHAAETINEDNNSNIDATFSPDGKHILVWGPNKAQVWDIGSARKIFEMPGNGAAMGAGYSSDGRFIVTGSGNAVRTWDPSTGIRLDEWEVNLEDVHGTISELTISPDSKFLLLSSDGGERMKLHELSSRRDIDKLEGSRPIFSPDGKAILTTTTEGKLILYNTQNRKSIPITGQIGTFSPDNKYILVGSSSVSTSHLRLCGREKVSEKGCKGRPIKILGHIEDVEFSPSGKLVTATTNEGVYLWNIDAEPPTGPLPERRDTGAEGPNSRSTSFSPDSRFLLRGSDSVLLDDLNSVPERSIGKLGGKSNVTTLKAAFSPDGQYALTLNNDGTIFVWDLNVWRSRVERSSEQSDLDAGILSPDGRFAATIEATKVESETTLTQVRVWKVENGETVHSFSQPENVNSLAFTPDNKLLLIVSKDTSYIWELNSRHCLAELKESDYGKVENISPDGKLFVTSNDKGTRVWDANSRHLVLDLPTENHVTRAVFSPDNKHLLILSQGKEQLCDLNGICRTVKQYKEDVSNALFSPDGKFILNVREDEFQVIDAQTGRGIIDPTAITDQISSTSFSPDGNYVMMTTYLDDLEEVSESQTNNDYSEVRVWDLKNHSQIYEFKGRFDELMLYGAFTPDGNTIIVLTTEGHLLTYNCEVCLPQEELINMALARNLRDLTLDERVRYLHESPD